MREIKFRAWDKIERKMWSPAIYEGVPYASNGLGGFVRMDGDLLDPLMQYTGLKDKNGVEIYYQDVIKVGDNIYRIEWADDFLQPCIFTQEQWEWFLDGSNHFKYCYQEDNIQDYFLCQLESYEIEVIGNIHESAELLS